MNVELGARVSFEFNCIVLDDCRIPIGDFRLFGPAVQIYTPLHPFSAKRRHREESQAEELSEPERACPNE